MMNRRRRRLLRGAWVGALLLVSLPWWVLVAAGGWWLIQTDRALSWLWLLLACSGAFLVLRQALVKQQQKMLRERGMQTGRERTFAPRDQAAWQAVEQVVADIAQQPTVDLESPETWLNLGLRTLQQVARHYDPEAAHPEWSVPLPWLLLINERVSHDLRQWISDLPGSHLITLSDLLVWRQRFDKLCDLATTWRVLRWLVNPSHAVWQEAIHWVKGQAIAQNWPTLQKMLLTFYIEKTGEYAILLYSGRIAVDGAELDALRPTVPEREEVGPLRILVAGQVKAGKSTLINALSGTLQTVTAAIPCTATIEGYRLERDGQPYAVIYDTPGYDLTSSWITDAPEQLEQTDLMLLVCSAVNAARAADARFLAKVNAYFLTRRERRPPPLVVVLTHIDLLRPATEWSPPYDFAHPSRLKEQQVHAALAAVREDLSLTEDCPTVPVCLHTQHPYNLQSVWQALDAQLAAAQLAQLHQLIHSMQARRRSRELLRQLRRSGEAILRTLR